MTLADLFQGIAFCEYADPAQATDIAVDGLNGMELGDKHLKVQRASIGNTQASGLEMGVNAMSMLAGTTSQGLDEGRVLQLLNMVTPEELIDNEDYEGKLLKHFATVCILLTSSQRNMRRREGRMREIRQSFGNEGSKTDWRKQTIKWGWKDLRQV